MITLFNPNTNNPFSVQYTNGSKVYKSTIVPGALVGFQDLSTLDQIKNFSALTRENITIYDFNNSSFAFRDSNSFSTGFKGTGTTSGMSFTTPLVTISTGYTFITSAATAGVALNSATATSVGNSFRVAYSGASVSTTTWMNALFTTAFSGFGISISGDSSSTFLASGASLTFTLSANTASSTANYTVFVGHNMKPENYVYGGALNFTTGLSALRARVTGTTS